MKPTVVEEHFVSTSNEVDALSDPRFFCACCCMISVYTWSIAVVSESFFFALRPPRKLFFSSWLRRQFFSCVPGAFKEMLLLQCTTTKTIVCARTVCSGQLKYALRGCGNFFFASQRSSGTIFTIYNNIYLEPLRVFWRSFLRRVVF